MQDAKENIATISETMLDEILELTDTDRKAVARAVAIIKSIQPTPEAQARLVVEGMEELLNKRQSKIKRMLQKMVSAAMGVFNDLEWW